MLTLHIICGVPGSGKSTLAKKIEVEESALRLTPDEWMDRIVCDGFDEDKRRVVEQMQCELAEKLLQHGVNVVLENGFWTRGERDEMRAMADRVGAVAKIYYFAVTKEEIWQRLQARNAALPPHTFPIDEARLDEALAAFEVPTADEPDVIRVIPYVS
jgi:predicted kinase